LSFNGTLDLRYYLSRFSSAILKGQWKASIKLKVKDEVVMYVKLPSDTTWLWIDE
jgi:hypothetical protein